MSDLNNVPEDMTEVPNGPNGHLPIFVFGSNLSGIHGAGSAKYAYENRGAIWRKGEGLMGSSYALPTKGLKLIEMTIEEVKASVDRFIAFAEAHPELEFQVTAVGCGLAGFAHSGIAPLFAGAPDNCMFDELWKPTFDDMDLDMEKRYWGTF